MRLSSKTEYALILYVAAFVFLNVIGTSFISEAAWAPYVNTASNTNAASGSAWVEGSDLHWADGGTEYTLTNLYTSDSTPGGSQGNAWVSGSTFRFINSNGYEKSFSAPLFITQYYYYDTGTWYNNNGHPSTNGDLTEFFDSSNSGVSFLGSGNYGDRIYWHSSSWDAKPSYLPADGYSWKVEGYLYAPSTGTYDFAVDSDDASDIIIDGQPVTEWYGGHGTCGCYTYSDSVSLDKGWHRFKARMEEGGGGDGIAVYWQKPSDSSWSIIPASSFSSTGDGTTSGPAGAMWLEDRYIHYIDSNGNERVLSSAVGPNYN